MQKMCGEKFYDKLVNFAAILICFARAAKCWDVKELRVNQFAESCRNTACAAFSPSIALETIPPEYPEPSPQG